MDTNFSPQQYTCIGLDIFKFKIPLCKVWRTGLSKPQPVISLYTFVSPAVSVLSHMT